MSFAPEFFTRDPASLDAWRALVRTTVDRVAAHLPETPYRGDSVAELEARLAGPVLPPLGRPMDAVMDDLAGLVERSIAVWHPHTAAHLHCPVLLPALAAEIVISCLNQSMDSFDQAPAATILEQRVSEWLCTAAGLPDGAGATFTSGGTQSNYMGLLLARDAFSQGHWGHSTRALGLHPEAGRLKILCSRHAHFSVVKSAFQLGLGADAVVPVDTDAAWRTSVDDLRAKLARLRAEGALPFAVVTTAGTTDFGAIPPLDAIADAAKEAGAWLHVDAAYGGALLLSPTHRAKLAGLHRADSITVDFHKGFYQPISASAFLLADARHYDLIRVHADYLNPEGHEEEGFPDLVNWSLLTTRRFDALKLWLSFQLIGAERFAQLIDRTIDLAVWFAERIDGDPRFDLLNRPDFGCIVFRYRAAPGTEDFLNDAIPKRLFRDGTAVLGHTRIDGRACLKVTLLNPNTEPADLLALLERIEACARRLTEVAPAA